MKRVEKSTTLNFIRRFVSKRHVAVLSLLSIAGSVALLLVAFMTKLIIDAIQSGIGGDFYIKVSIAVVLLLAYAVSYGLGGYLATKFSLSSTKKIVSYCHHHLLQSEYSKVTDAHSVEMLKIVTNDAETAVTNYITLFPTVLSMLVKIVAGIALMAYISWQITLIAAAVGLALCLALAVTKKPIKRLYKKSQEKIAVSNAYMQESLKNIEVIKALNAADYVKDGVLLRLEDVKKAIEKKSKLYNAMNAVSYFVLEITFLLILVFGGGLILAGRLSLADFVVLISVIEIIKAPFITASNISTSFFSMLASAERALTVVRLKTDEYVYGDFDKIVFENVSYEYNNKTAVRDFNLELSKNETVILYGNSGVGKTTLIRLLTGIISPSKGKIYLQKGDKTTLLNGKLFNVGYAPQNLQLFNDTVYNNLVCGKTVGEDKIIEVLRLTDIYDDVMAKPGGLNYVLKEGGTGLSQGQMQRISIARALLSDSDVIVLDEPFASLDKPLAEDIFDKLYSAGKTMILISHDEFVREKGKTVYIEGEKLD